MEFINKINQTSFHPNFINFENNKWNTLTNIYGNYNYDGFNTNFKEIIKGHLLNEQDHLCCYCMKQLENNYNSSIEHLYPKNPQQHNVFQNYGILCIEKILFDFSTRQVPNSSLDNLPHDISYYNLVACCIKCNNTRDTKEIRPFVFDSNVNTDFNYNDKGYILSTKYEDEIFKIGLADEYYVNYRRLWKYISKTNNNSIFGSDKKLKDSIIKAALKLYIETKSIFYVDFLQNGYKVKEAIAYQYFFN